jgi:hypothetical protein
MVSPARCRDFYARPVTRPGPPFSPASSYFIIRVTGARGRSIIEGEFMQKGMNGMIMKGTLACVCLLNLVISVAVLAQRHDGRGGDPASRAGGKVTAIAGASITVQGRDGNSTVINVAADAKVERNGKSAALADFKVGDFVFAHGARNSDGQFVADRLMGGDQPRDRGPGEGRSNGLFGELQSVDGASRTLTVKTRDGATQTIYTTDGTEFNRNRQAATLADFKAGDHVGADGARNGDGHFVAERVFGGDAPQRHRQQ